MIKFMIISTFYRLLLRRPKLWYGHPDTWNDADWELYQKSGL